VARKKRTLAAASTADLLERIAERVARSDPAFALQAEIMDAVMALGDMRHIPGLQLVSSVAFRHLVAGKAVESLRYETLKQRVRDLPPADPAGDAEALRALAVEIRGK
jgi:hypothetical protein